MIIIVAIKARLLFRLYGVLIIVMHGVRERSKVGAAGCRGRVRIGGTRRRWLWRIISISPARTLAPRRLAPTALKID